MYIDDERKRAIGKRIQSWRKQRKITQEKFAALIERSTDAVSMIERGINFPSRETLERMSKVLDIPIKDFLTFESENPTPNAREQTINKIIGLLHTLDDRDLKAVLGLVEGFK
jgi:transcriptional regulator with XRE-family HTH domain